MNRGIVYPGQIPLDTDILYAQQAAMVAMGWSLQAALGTAANTVFNGLAVTQTSVPSMSVTVAPGAIVAQQELEPNAYGSISPDTTDLILKMGINIAATALGPMSAPVTSGQSVVYLVEAAFSETDSVTVVLPYVNAANPASPYSGPSNTAASQNTRRLQSVTLQLKVGTPATTGSQVAPAADSGFVPLYTVTIANGAVTVVNANIALAASAPLLAGLLNSHHGGITGQAPKVILTSEVQGILPVTNGGAFQNVNVYTNVAGTQYVSVNGASAVTAGATSFPAPASGIAEVELWGAGGASGGTLNTNSGSGPGAAGGYAKGRFTGIGTAQTITVGLGGTAGNTTPTSGAGGATSSFGSLISATGGNGGQGANGATTIVLPAAGSGTGGYINIAGGPGTLPFTLGGGLIYAAEGGASAQTPAQFTGIANTAVAGLAGQFPGGGAAGSVNGANGAAGANGCVIVRY